MLLGIDLGTGSAKALLLSVDGVVIAEASNPYPVQAPHPGWAETDPAAWWSAVGVAVKTAVGDRSEQVQAIGLSGQMHGVVLTDTTGQPLRPAILWADTRSSQMLTDYHKLTAAQRQALANPITVGMAGPTLLWIRQHEPDLYYQARWALQPKDWLRSQLTATIATDPSDASGTLLYNVSHDCWATTVLEALNLRSDWLPDVVPSNHIAGSLTSAAARHLNLPAGIPVVAGAADTAAAMLGSRLTEPGIVQLTIGTAAQLVTPRSHPIVDPQARTHTYRTALPQQWYTLAAVQNAGLALEWARTQLGFSWSQVYAEALSVPPGCGGLTFLPYLTGERTPHLDPHARAAWVGMGLHHTRAHLMRSALEGVAFAIRQGLQAILATDISPSFLRLAGGGSLEPTWRQLLADILQLPLHSAPAAAASAQGAALLAGLGIGCWREPPPLSECATSIHVTHPNPPCAELQAAWQRFCDLYPAVRAISLS